MRTDVAGLSKLIALPFPPKAAWWRIVEREGSGAMGPADWELMAVVQFSSQDVEAIISKSENQRSDPPENMAAGSPAMSEILRDHGPVGERLYGADPFVKSPLLEGFFARVKGANKLLIYLSTC
ncbi:hypothetical protein GeomeDRAFT_2219 [Geobacter metallireducens RCH3]|uniref:hypothetical protein n=1 Tax=Geobacter TaxID=28231 RepID=UPI00024A5250|nr:MULTISPECIES: hypothetical protein [Geobacter]EHP85968.1 hypothetical protein GeomeDRAFT_2219 [Geobacter metallireducens RCH3]MBT1076836.1 hypothetical protein [Geobacter grbiciae]